MNSHKALLHALSRFGVIPDQLPSDLFAESTSGPIHILARAGTIDEREAIKKLSQGLGVEWIDLDSAEVISKLVTASYKGKVNADFCWEHKIVPLFDSTLPGKPVVVAMANPLDVQSLKAVEFGLARPTRAVIAEESKILRLLGEQLPPSSSRFNSTVDASSAQTIEIVGAGTESDPQDDTASTINLCNKIIAVAVEAKASDIHVEPMQHSVEVRCRVDGVMRTEFEIPKRLQLQIISRLKLLAAMDIAEKRRPQDGRLQVRVAGESLDIRASSVPTSYGEKMVLRLLRAESEMLSLEALGMPAEVQAAMRTALQARGKLLLSTGPTGSGKSTSLYSCLKELRDGTTNIETVENPVEYRIPGIHQIQINEAIGVTFASALRSILRQDPDVIMVGEIRDKETAEIALQAAQTGHLVLSTLHTNDAPSAISRFLSLGIEPFTIANGLGGVLAQRLVRKICDGCCEPMPQPSDKATLALLKAAKVDPSMLKSGKGCPKCRMTGYRGRLGVFSFLSISEAISNLIHQQAPMSAVLEQARKEGFMSLETAAQKLLLSGATTIDEVRDFLVSSAGTVQTIETATSVVVVPSPARETVDVTSESASGIKRKKVLLVEDDENIRAMISMILKREMFDVVEAANGEEGMQQVYQHNPSIVLCDLMMPKMNGKEFLSRMRGDEQTKDIPVVMLTAVNTEENEVELLNLGARDFVGKNSSASVLLSRVRRVLRS